MLFLLFVPLSLKFFSKLFIGNMKSISLNVSKSAHLSHIDRCVQTDSNSYQLGFFFTTECDIYQSYGPNVLVQICLRLVVSLAFQNLYAVIAKSFEGKKLITPQNGQIVFVLYFCSLRFPD